MAYQIQRKKMINDTLELLDENGNVGCKVHVRLDADSIALEFIDKYNIMVAAQKKLDVLQAEDDVMPEQIRDALLALIDTVICMMQILFGNDATNEIIKFYEDRRWSMCLDILPFIQGAIVPAVSENMNARSEELRQKYAPKKKGFFRR